MKWFPIDLAAVSLFAWVGRLSHEEAVSLVGWWGTAWPFLCGALLGWAVVAATRRPGGSPAAGLVIWACTLVGGMLLRQAADQGTAPAFAAVAAAVLGLLLVAPRLATGALARTSADAAGAETTQPVQ